MSKEEKKSWRKALLQVDKKKLAAATVAIVGTVVSVVAAVLWRKANPEKKKEEKP